jgi:hypothetical protein
MRVGGATGQLWGPTTYQYAGGQVGAARSGPRFARGFLALLAGYENLAAPLFALSQQCKLEVAVTASGGSL